MDLLEPGLSLSLSCPVLLVVEWTTCLLLSSSRPSLVNAVLLVVLVFVLNDIVTSFC
jgi:hypothetical protein